MKKTLAPGCSLKIGPGEYAKPGTTVDVDQAFAKDHPHLFVAPASKPPAGDKKGSGG